MKNPSLPVGRVAALALLLTLGVAHAQTEAAPATAASSSVQANVSSDRNVPAATARQQAAEVARGDPARWSQEDRDSAARMKTLRKETAAALQESLGNCRALPQAERAGCVKQARSTYQQEMAGLKSRLASGE